MGNYFPFGRGSTSTGQLKVNVKHLKTGKIVNINVQKPFEYTVDQLLGQVISKFSGQDKVERERISLRYKKEDIVGSNHEKTLGEVLSLDSNAEAATTTVNLFLERVERGGISRDWIIYIKTLTGRIFDLSFYSPQEIGVIGLKLLIEEECDDEFKPDQMRLVLDSQQLEDNKLIQDYSGITKECTIHLVMK